MATVDVRAARRDQRSTRLSVTVVGSPLKGSQTTATLVLHVQRGAILPPKAKNLIGRSPLGSCLELLSLDLRGLLCVGCGHVSMRSLSVRLCGFSRRS